MLRYDLKEHVNHGKKGFPVSIYPVNIPYPNVQILPYHWHDEFEFIYVYKGIGKFTIENEQYIIKKGEALIINADELHGGYSSELSKCYYCSFVFNINYLAESINDICEKKYINDLVNGRKKIINFISFDETWKIEVITIIRKIIRSLIARNNGFELYIKGQLLIILSILFSSNAIIDVPSDSSKKSTGNAENIKQVLKFIDDNYMNDITVEELAQIARISKFHFIHVFKDVIGMSPIKYINMTRINEAAALLRSGNVKITEAASKCGFNNIGYFIKTFKIYKNITPNAYIKLFDNKYTWKRQS